MKNRWFLFAATLLLAFPGCQKDKSATGQDIMATPKGKLSYSLGYNIGTNLKKASLDLAHEGLSQGIRDALSGSQSLLNQEEMTQILSQLQQDMGRRQQEQKQKLAEQNQAAGEAFLKENSKKPGVQVTASGLQYRVLKPGSGPKPKATDTVRVHYRGTLINGQEFDSSYKRNQPAVFQLNGVIKGWIEALQLMSVGSKWEIAIPASLAYGAQAAGNMIGPGSTLIFEVELLGIEKPAAAPQTKPNTQKK